MHDRLRNLVRSASRRSPAGLLAVAALLLAVTCPRAQPLNEEMLTPSDLLPGEFFGSAVAVDGDVALIGASRDNDPVIMTGEYGAAYVFRHDGEHWVEEAKLTAPDRNSFDWFGRSVAIDGKLAVVGTRGAADLPPYAGAVHVYQFDGVEWIEETRLTAPDTVQSGEFGSSLDVEGDVILIGSPFRTITNTGQGAAFVYRHDGTGWVQEAQLTASDPADAAHFGAAVSLSGARALVGALGDSPADVGQNAGAAYMFEFDGVSWTETAKLTASDPALQASFGISVALDGDLALIGAFLDDEAAGGAGAAYVFRYDGSQWTEEAKLHPSGDAGFHLFGTSVALDAPKALVGADNWFPPGEDATGNAYVFEYDEALQTWRETAGLVPEDVAGGDKFGSAVAISGDVLLIGAPEYDAPGGAVFAYGQPQPEPPPTSAEEPAGPSAFVLSDPWPNPFHDRTRFTLTMGSSRHVRVALFDMLGREVRVFHDGVLHPHSSPLFTVTPGALSSGLYLIRATTSTSSRSRFVVLQR